MTPKPPASLIEDGYSTDLVPHWRYLLGKLNPLRLIKQKTEMKWRSVDADFYSGNWGSQWIVALSEWEGEDVMAAFNLSDVPFLKHLSRATHWCPLPPLP